MYVRKIQVARILGVLQGTCVDILGGVVVRTQDAIRCIVGHPATLVLINVLLGGFKDKAGQQLVIQSVLSCAVAIEATGFVASVIGEKEEQAMYQAVEAMVLRQVQEAAGESMDAYAALMSPAVRLEYRHHHGQHHSRHSLECHHHPHLQRQQLFHDGPAPPLSMRRCNGTGSSISSGWRINQQRYEEGDFAQRCEDGDLAQRYEDGDFAQRCQHGESTSSIVRMVTLRSVVRWGVSSVVSMGIFVRRHRVDMRVLDHRR